MDEKVTHSRLLKLVSFNCKNIRTCEYVMDDLLVKYEADILLLQEHWLFGCQLHRLNEISDLCVGQSKSVDTGDLILPVQMPRGYGGKAILWKKQIDHVIKPLDVGGNQIQCVAKNVCEPLLLISEYMPCRGVTDNYTEFKDTLDQLSVILSQYAPTHQIIIGGDLNEDITQTANGARPQYLREFMKEHELKTQPT